MSADDPDGSGVRGLGWALLLLGIVLMCAGAWWFRWGW